MADVARIVFMGTPEFAVPCLQTLIETQQVVGVVTQPDRPAGRGSKLRPSPVKVVAEAAGIPVYQPQSLKKEEAAAPLREWQPDMIVVAAFGQILRRHVLELPPRGCLNVHASLLPRWRGASPIQHAILAGDSASGVTLMQMDEGLDTGAMYVQESLALDPRETAASLHDKLSLLGADMLRRNLDEILAGRIIPSPQDGALSTYAPMIRKEEGRIDWQRTAVELDRQIRAMTPWPGTYTHWQGEALKILRARPGAGLVSGGPPGRVVESRGGIFALTGGGSLLLEEVQLPGKQGMGAADFARGRPAFVGSDLGEAGT